MWTNLSKNGQKWTIWTLCTKTGHQVSKIAHKQALVYHYYIHIVRSRVKFYQCETVFTTDAGKVNVFKNIRLKAPIEFKNSLNVEKTAMFLYFAMMAQRFLLNNPVQMPTCIVDGTGVRNWNSFAKNMLIPTNGSTISNQQLVMVAQLYFTSFIFTRKDIIDAMSSIPAEYMVIYDKNVKAPNGEKGGLINMALNNRNMGRVELNPWYEFQPDEANSGDKDAIMNECSNEI